MFLRAADSQDRTVAAGEAFILPIGKHMTVAVVNGLSKNSFPGNLLVLELSSVSVRAAGPGRCHSKRWPVKGAGADSQRHGVRRRGPGAGAGDQERTHGSAGALCGDQR